MEILAHIIAYAIYAVLILAGLGFAVRICQYFYYREYRSDSVKVYYDDNDHRKGYYIVRRPRGPYPVGYSHEKIVRDMEAFERLKREQKAKERGKVDLSLWPDIPEKDSPSYHIPKKPRPRWLQILLMTPAEYLEERRSKKTREG